MLGIRLREALVAGDDSEGGKSKEMPENFASRGNPGLPAPAPTNPSPRGAPRQTPPSGALTGVEVIDLNPRLASTLALPPETKGVVVNQINPASPAADVLRDGDLIEEVNQVPVATAADYARAVAGLPANRDIMLSIVRDRARSFVVVPAGR